jgi:hypothetical protein
MDAPRIKTAPPNDDRGFDGHQQRNGRQRHSWGDTLGVIMAVVGPAAGTDDRLGLVA